MSPSATAAPQFIDFQPTREAASDILIALADPDQTAREIAQRFHTTLDALAEWFDTPPVQQRIEKMKRFAVGREDLILTINKRLALETLVSILEAHQHDEQHIPVDPQNLKAITQRDRRRAAARLAASQLIRLAQKLPLPEGGGRGVGSSDARDQNESRSFTQPTNPPPTPPSGRGADHVSDSLREHPSAPNSPAHIITSSPTSTADTHLTTGGEGGQAASGTQSLLRAPPCDPVFQHAASNSEAG